MSWAQNSSDDALEIITVTAQRQPASLMSLSSNLQWVDEHSIELLQAQHIQQVLSQVSGVWVSRGNGQEHLTAIRSPVLTGSGSCGAFFMAEDGLSLRAPGFCNANQLFDVNSEQAARIEVVKGANSTLYGSNALHGVINVLSPDAWQVKSHSLSLELGPHAYQRAKFSLATHTAQQAWLVYGHASEDGGFQTDSGYKQQKLNIIQQINYSQWQVKNLIALSHLDQETAGYVEGPQAYADPILRRTNPNPEAYRDASSLRAYSQWRWRNTTLSQFSVTPYIRVNQMTFLQHFVPWQPIEDNGHKSMGINAWFSQQFRDVNLLTGFDWDTTWGSLQEQQSEDFSPNIPAGFHYDYAVRASVYSPFTELRWAVTESTQLVAGLRFEQTELDYNNHLSDGSACAAEVPLCRFIRPADEQRHYQQWSGKLAVQHALSAQLSLYAQWSQGYRVPQVNELYRLQDNQTSASLEPEQSDAYEVGLRGSVNDINIELNGYYLDKTQVILQDPQRQTINDGATSHKGLELSLRYAISDHVYLASALTYAEHKYTEGVTAEQQNIRGRDIDSAPRHMASTRFGWQGDDGLQLEMEWLYLGSYFLNPQNTASYPGHHLLHVRAVWPLSEGFELSLRVQNLSDVAYAERADFAFGNYRYFVGEGRSSFLSAKMTF
ncbi:MAG: TonB-dependent receptor [Paraglaciecola sp.]|nr:TonB-dependent receptor [Paraglaciecola sp.]NCT49335.1 TonB-dependent receptor [Paraglaciecola sp.]